MTNSSFSIPRIAKCAFAQSDDVHGGFVDKNLRTAARDKVEAILYANLAELEYLETVDAARPGTRESILAIRKLLAMRKSRRPSGPRNSEKPATKALSRRSTPRAFSDTGQACWSGSV